jgi:hypothetical protein
VRGPTGPGVAAPVRGGAAAPPSWHEHLIDGSEIPVDSEDGTVLADRQGVSEAIPEVQGEAQPGPGRDPRLGRIGRHESDPTGEEALLVHRIMNSFRVLAGSGQSPLTEDFGHELVGRVGPLDRASPSIALGEEGQDALTHVGGALEVVGRERLPMQLADHDLDLVEPGTRRKPGTNS